MSPFGRIRDSFLRHRVFHEGDRGCCRDHKSFYLKPSGKIRVYTVTFIASSYKRCTDSTLINECLNHIQSARNVLRWVNISPIDHPSQDLLAIWSGDKSVTSGIFDSLVLFDSDNVF